MYRGTKDIMLPTTITGSLPRPSWYTENLGTRHFLEAMVTRRFREQYEDAVTCYLRDQELAGLDIVTDGDAHFDDDVGGQSWTAYPPNHMSGLDAAHPEPTPAGRGGIMFPRGHILHDYLESRVMPVITGPISRGNLQYTAMWKAAQRFTTRPVKFGAVSRRRLSRLRCRTATTRAFPTACLPSPTPSTRNITNWLTPAARSSRSRSRRST
jgi:5-methyltetrahydropteroyltriglutamate--homocysteine methyltransferase